MQLHLEELTHCNLSYLDTNKITFKLNEKTENNSLQR